MKKMDIIINLSNESFSFIMDNVIRPSSPVFPTLIGGGVVIRPSSPASEFFFQAGMSTSPAPYLFFVFLMFLAWR